MDFLRSLPNGDTWICIGVAIAVLVVLRFIVKRIILIIFVAAVLALLAWWLMYSDASPVNGIAQTYSMQ